MKSEDIILDSSINEKFGKEEFKIPSKIKVKAVKDDDDGSRSYFRRIINYL